MIGMDKEVMSYDWMKEIDKKRKSNKTYYNWYELKKEAGGHPEGILILTYALYKRYNTLMAKNTHSLCKNLHISSIPTKIIRNNHIMITLEYKEVISHYMCRDEQSYFTNGSFLTAICPVRKKLEYLFLLSMRPANDLSARVPQKFLTQEQIIWAINNPFIKTIEDKIVFVPELIRNKGEK